MAAKLNCGGGGYCECITSHAVYKESMESYRYYLSRRTVLEMLKDRGYDVPASELTRPLSEFRSVFGDEPDVERLRLCVPLRASPSKKITDLLVNITKHILQPKNEVLTAQETRKLLQKYRLEDKQLPLMLETDALARYYGLKKGQVMKLSYCNGIAGSLETSLYFLMILWKMCSLKHL